MKTYLDGLHESCAPLHSHSHGGVDAAREGDVDEGHQDGDGLEQGQVLREDNVFTLYLDDLYLPELEKVEKLLYRQD